MGRLTADPELKQTQSGIPTCRFTVAINRNYAPKDGGERQADFINVVTWRQSAEFVSKYFSKGKMIIVEGSIHNNNYTDNNGVKHYGYDVVADNVAFGETKNASGGNSDNNGGSYQTKNQNSSAQPQQTQNSQDSDLSFGDLSDFEEILGDGDVPF